MRSPLKLLIARRTGISLTSSTSELSFVRDEAVVTVTLRMSSLSKSSLEDADLSSTAQDLQSQETGDVRELFSFQLQRLAGLSSKIANLSIGPQFGITLFEWRVLAVLSYLERASLQQLTNHVGKLKSQTSRAVSPLVERGLIDRFENAEDGRSVLLNLTPAGKRMVEDIYASSRIRNEHMLEGLSAAERQLLNELIQRVFKASYDHYMDLKKTKPLSAG